MGKKERKKEGEKWEKKGDKNERNRKSETERERLRKETIFC